MISKQDLEKMRDELSLEFKDDVRYDCGHLSPDYVFDQGFNSAVEILWHSEEERQKLRSIIRESGCRVCVNCGCDCIEEMESKLREIDDV